MNVDPMPHHRLLDLTGERPGGSAEPSPDVPPNAPYGSPLREMRPRAKTHGRRRTVIAATLIALAASAGAVTWWWLGSSANAAEDRATATVARGDVEDTVTALGNLQPRDFVDVGAQVSGQLTHID